MYCHSAVITGNYVMLHSSRSLFKHFTGAAAGRAGPLFRMLQAP